MIGCVFTDNGDLIVEGNLELLRINGTDGSTIWSVEAIPWVIGWLCPVIYGNTIYVQQNAFESITAFDVNTGQKNMRRQLIRSVATGKRASWWDQTEPSMHKLRV
jgi:outer membrane protein assembly factor BamB